MTHLIPKKKHTIDGEPAEHSTGFQTPADFIHPLVIKVHPRRLGASDLARLRVLPEVKSVKVLPQPHGVDAPSSLRSIPEQAESGEQHGAGRWGARVAVASGDQDEGTEEEDDGRQGVGEPEADVFFRVGHADLTNQSPDVDEKVEILLVVR